ncbi:hypothetical protein BX666DRAFT_886019 [Dichotomocladium elegans]|nr:hypothetical protein BX666DRAFT_886019 [Dichotomocladium elegans]
MASDQNEPATQEILRDTKVMFPMDSRHERDMAHEITVRSSYDDDNAPSQDTSQSDSGEETPYVDVNEAPDWIDEEDGLQTRSDVGEQANGSATAITENDPNEQQQQTPNLALEQGKEKESEKAKDAARQHFVDAVENISLMAMLLDFEHSPRIPTFFQRIVQAYLANLRNDRVILDAACEAAVAFQNYLESSHGLPLTTLSPDEFRNLLASDLQPTQESTSVQTDDPLVATALAPELDTRSTGDRPSAAE